VVAISGYPRVSRDDDLPATVCGIAERVGQRITVRVGRRNIIDRAHVIQAIRKRYERHESNLFVEGENSAAIMHHDGSYFI